MQIKMYIATWFVWNVFLAAIPVGLGYLLVWLSGLRDRGLSRQVLWPLLGITGLVWLLFLPNTCYLLTEWRHFLYSVERMDLSSRWRHENDAAIMLMMQTFFYMIYSGIGVLTFVLATRPVAHRLSSKGVRTWPVGIPFFLLMSLGVYLGLILRFNTWDFVWRAHEIWRHSVALLGRPDMVAFLVGFAGVLWLVFLAADIWIDGFLCRMGKSRESRAVSRES